jgi:outer membrane protein TolC
MTYRRRPKTMMRIAALLGLALGLSGCSLLDPAPPCQRLLPPEVYPTAVPGLTPSGVAGDAAIDCPAPPVTPVIPPPTKVVPIDLPEALRVAGAENPTIAIAQEAVRLAQAQQEAARVLLLPNLHGGMSYDHHDGNLQASFGAIRRVDRQSLYAGAGAGVSGAGTITIPGIHVYSSLAEAIFDPLIARYVVTTRQFEAVATNNSVLLDVGVLYFGLVGAEGQLAALRQTEQEVGEVARLTADQARVGQGLPSDADRARSEARLFEQDEQRAQEEVAVAAAQLAQLLNIDPTCRLQTAPGPVQLLELINPSLPLCTLIEIALDYRPEMQARMAAIAAGEIRYRQEWYRPLLPTLSVGYSAGVFGGGSNLVETRFGHFAERTDLDVYAYWTLQNLGLGNLALQNQRQAQVGQAQAELVLTINQIREAVAQAYADSAARAQELAVARRQLERARDGYQRDLRRVRALEGKPIEVLDSARLLASARQEFVRALAEYNQAQLRLFVSLGQPPPMH